ncbi:MAG: hypothetical protein JXR80_07710, partial [Deltaproteobacteria bacterium]|nr:hypothetical protein [Deltaproteobacteria bacterium]
MGYVFRLLLVSVGLFSGLFGYVHAACSLPDTGQTLCYNNTGVIACPAPGEPFYGQDAQFTRDRSYTRLDALGKPWSEGAAEPWVMV